MDWNGVMAANLAQIEENEEVAEALYAFLLANEVAEDSEVARDAGKVAKVLAVMRAVMKVRFCQHTHVPT